MGKNCIIAFTKNGVNIAEKLNMGDIYVFYKYNKCHIPFNKISDIMAKCWSKYNNIIFISACGIAVRAIAPFVQNKMYDPAVVVCDDNGKFAISLLSGHIGGANKLANNIACVLGGIPVVTTATDVNNKLAIDEWAKENGLYICDMKMAKEVSSAIVNGNDVGYCGILPCPKDLKEHIQTDIGVYVGYKIEKPFKNTLILATKSIILGIGCRANTPYENIKNAVYELFERENVNIRAISQISSIDVKKCECGIIKFAEEIGVEFKTYSADVLNSIEGEFSYSEFVKNRVGTDCVCERSAVAEGGELIVKKQKFAGITLAVAVKR